MKGKRHLTPKEIMAQCKAVARECRMADRTPWTIVGILVSYAVMESEDFRGKRILKILNKISEMEELWENGKLDFEDTKQKVYAKIGDGLLEHTTYKESDITHKKGSYDYWLDSKQIDPQNTMNEYLSRYLVFFFTSLIEDFGYGKERLMRVFNYIDNLLQDYRLNRTTISVWRKALREKAGIVLEMPKDTITKTAGSMMLGWKEVEDGD